MTYAIRTVLRSRPRAVWFALGTGIFACLAVAVIVLTPVLGLVATGASFGPLVRIPMGAITITVIGGYALAAGLLALAALNRNGAIAWILAVGAFIATLVVSIYPLFAAAFASVDSAQDAIPFILDWIGRARDAIG